MSEEPVLDGEIAAVLAIHCLGIIVIILKGEVHYMSTVQWEARPLITNRIFSSCNLEEMQD